MLAILYNQGNELYEKLPLIAQGFISKFARDKIYAMEKDMYAKGATKEEAQFLRPAKGQDASLRMAEIMLAGFKEMSKYAEIQCQCNEYGEITDFSYQLKDKSQAGG